MPRLVFHLSPHPFEATPGPLKDSQVLHKVVVPILPRFFVVRSVDYWYHSLTKGFRLHPYHVHALLHVGSMLVEPFQLCSPVVVRLPVPPNPNIVPAQTVPMQVGY